ncbi:hypothetical protein [Staphylococcus ureilyticus]|uniref:hypothetical protein n=1 Tax=Staphylococcus ureilyticus TaxID=94138 RepID=UPI002157074F|nr:hypothetical protein [Staphylococcus ureilyticus]
MKKENIDLYNGYSYIDLSSDSEFAEFTNFPKKNIYKLPGNVSDKESHFLFDDTIAIFGTRTIVLLTVIVVKNADVSKILVFDLSEERLNKAKVMGDTHIIILLYEVI